MASTIYDVAKQAGVSVATVSNVLNAPERVRPATRDRVLEAIDHLDFVPKHEAAVRARKAIGRIGVVAPISSYPSFNERLRGMFEALRERSFELVLYDQESVAVRRDYLTSLPLSRRLDGLIVAMPFDDKTAGRLITRELPTVLLEFTRPDFSGVDIDDEAGGALAGTYLIGKGHQRCAFLGERQVSHFVVTQAERRLVGFRRALQAAGLTLPDEYTSLGPFGVEEARRQVHELLNLATPPSAIFAHSDIQAIGALKAARDRGVRVPDGPRDRRLRRPRCRRARRSHHGPPASQRIGPGRRRAAARADRRPHPLGPDGPASPHGRGARHGVVPATLHGGRRHAATCSRGHHPRSPPGGLQRRDRSTSPASAPPARLGVARGDRPRNRPARRRRPIRSTPTRRRSRLPAANNSAARSRCSAYSAARSSTHS